MNKITLTKIFGSCPDVAILECFADNYKEDLSVEDIVCMSDVPRTTVYRKIKKLVEKGIVKKTKKYGRTQLYRLNVENDIAKAIVHLEITIAQTEMKELMKKEDIAIPIGTIISSKGEKAIIDFREKDSTNASFFSTQERMNYKKLLAEV